MSQCEILKEVETKFGAKAATYLKNKHTGGTNNEKGAVYESNFATFQLSNLCYQVLTLDHDIDINTQLLAFVDDLIVINRTENSSYSYQLKNVQSISWNGGIHPLECDFRYHYELNKEQGIENPNTILTVSNPKLHDRLSKSIPASISEHTECLLFEDEPLNVALVKESALKNSLIEICSYNDPDKLTQLHTVMKGVWENNKGQFTSVRDFLTEIRKIKPHFLRYFTEDFVIESRLAEIFENIKGFSYEIFENQLKYSYSCDKNSFSFDGFFELDSPEFKSHSKVIIMENPSTFAELLGLELL